MLKYKYKLIFACCKVEFLIMEIINFIICNKFHVTHFVYKHKLVPVGFNQSLSIIITVCMALLYLNYGMYTMFVVL